MTIINPEEFWGQSRNGIALKAVFAIIDPNYVNGKPRVIIEGETTLTSPKNYYKGYTPVAGDKVLLVRDVIVAAWEGS